MPAVVCMGDSITNGLGLAEPWPQKLCFLLGPTYSVYNVGVTGQTSSSTLANWTSGVDNKLFNYVVVLTGINDIRLSTTAAAIYANLEAIYNGCLADVGCTPVLITLLPAGTSPAWDGAPMQAQLDALNALIRTYASTNSVPIWDGYAAMGEPGNPTMLATAYGPDGLHPNQAGADVIAAAVAAVILA